MKTNFRIAAVIFLAATWFLATGAASKAYTYSGFRDGPASSRILAIPDFSAELFCNAATAESEADSGNYLPVPNFKDTHSDPGEISKAIEQLLEVGFAQYSRLSKNFLVHHRKSDIIFPFHYFW